MAGKFNSKQNQAGGSFRTVAEESLLQSSSGRGVAPMQSRTQAPPGLVNAADSGGYSKPMVNPQAGGMEFIQQTQALQQNVMNNMNQQAAGSTQLLREKNRIANNKAEQVERFKRAHVMASLEATGGSQALMQLGQISQSPALHQFLGDLAGGASQAEKHLGASHYLS